MGYIKNTIEWSINCTGMYIHPYEPYSVHLIPAEPHTPLGGTSPVRRARPARARARGAANNYLMIV